MVAPTETARVGIPIDPDLLPTTQDAEMSVPAAPRRRRRRIRRPARNSLYDLMHDQAGLSLFVRPLFWNENHVQHLRASFTELPPCDTPLPTDVLGSAPSNGHMRPSQAIVTLSEALTEILLPTSPHHSLSSNAVKTVLGLLWPEAFSAARYFPELHIFFGDRVYREAVRAQVMWQYPPKNKFEESVRSFHSVSTRPATSFGLGSENVSSSPNHDPSGHPMMCYLGKNQLESMRKNIFRVAPGPQSVRNDPVWRLQQLRIKMLMPADPDQDPHLIGIFLAMAQRHFYGLLKPLQRREHPWNLSRQPERPAFHDISLRILTHDTETAEFIVYSATVKASFLKRFDDPFSAPVGEDGELTGIHIEYSRVPIWPILGLRERLGTALGQEIVGQFDPTQIETWEEESKEEAPQDISATPTKRKREALSEVLNGSFEDDSSEDSAADEPAITGKRRCLSEGAPVGMVV
jgi:hypothetical protein